MLLAKIKPVQMRLYKQNDAISPNERHFGFFVAMPYTFTIAAVKKIKPQPNSWTVPNDSIYRGNVLSNAPLLMNRTNAHQIETPDKKTSIIGMSCSRTFHHPVFLFHVEHFYNFKARSPFDVCTRIAEAVASVVNTNGIYPVPLGV